MKLLECINVRKCFSNVCALDNCNLSIHGGEFIVLAGANGSGKTVLMKHMNGLFRADSGEVRYRDTNIFKDLRLVRTRVGLVFQHSDMQFVGLNVEREIAFGPENLGLSKAELSHRVKEIAESFNLASLLSRRPHELSGGEKKRLAIASVVAMDPEIILLDEPFAGLDYPGVISVLETLDRLFRKGHTLLVITHDLEKVLAAATRMIVMKTGSIVYDGAPCIDESLFRNNAIHVPQGQGRDLRSMRWI